MEKRNIFAPMKVGIIFGGSSREREMSFLAGRTVYESLDKSLFEAVPVFADSLGNFILLEWRHLYQDSIRDFYPPAEAVPDTVHSFSIYIESLGELSPEHQEAIITRVGRRLEPTSFRQYFDFAFLTLPGSSGEREKIITFLAEKNIPYTGSEITATEKLSQFKEMAALGFPVAPSRLLAAADWAEAGKRAELFQVLKQELKLPFVLYAPNRSFPGGNVVIKEDDYEAFTVATEHVFSQKTIRRENWSSLSPEQQITFIKNLTDLRQGIGLPVNTGNSTVIHHPEQLLQVIQRLFTETDQDKLTFYSTPKEPYVVAASLPAGIAFRCLVIQDPDGGPLALSPKGIKSDDLVSDKGAIILPEQEPHLISLNLPPVQMERIRQACSRLFKAVGLQVYANLNGIVTEAGEILIIDFDPAPPLLPAAFVFRQAAEIGLNPSQFLTYIIRTSLTERLKDSSVANQFAPVLQHLEEAIKNQYSARHHKIKVGILMGGESAARNISVTSGLNIFMQLAASDKYHPVPIFRSGSGEQVRYFLLPLPFLFLEEAEAIKQKINERQSGHLQPVLPDPVGDEAGNITAAFAGSMLRDPQYISYDQLRNLVDLVFISFPGQVEDDGDLQTALEKLMLPYTGSGLASIQLVKNKSGQNVWLRRHGVAVAEHLSADDKANGVTVIGGLLTRYLPDGRLSYEVFEPSEVVGAGDNRISEDLITGGKRCLSFPARYRSDPEVNRLVSEKVKAVFSKAAQVLNLEGYAQLEALVSCHQPDAVEISIREIELTPALAPNACIFRQAAGNGYKPYDFLDRVLQFSLDRQKKKV